MWWMLSAAAAPCEPSDPLLAAYDALLAGEIERAESALAETERSLGCAARPASKELLGKFWLVEAALLDRSGDPDAELSLAAARRTAPELWLFALGPALEARWRSAKPEEGTGQLALDIPLVERSVAVDGEPWLWADLPAGLHLVQISEPDGAISHGSIVYIGASTSTTLKTGLAPERPSEEVPQPAPSRPDLLSQLSPEATLALGASLAVGRRLQFAAEKGPLVEPAAKLVVPLSLSASVRPGTLWARLEAGTGVLLGGTYLGVLADRTVYRTSLRYEVALAAGGSVSAFDVGASTSIQWPGRLAERAVISYRDLGELLPLDLPDGDLLSVELRPGFNVATDRPIEPAFELLVGYVLR